MAIFNSGVRGKRAKDGVGIVGAQTQFIQQQSPTPTITSYSISGVDDLALAPSGGQTVVVYGTGFASGMTGLVGSSVLGAVTVLSSTSVSFTTPALSSGSYTLTLANTNGSAAILVPGLVYSSVPVFSTSAGSIGSYYETKSINTSVSATSDTAITYTLASGTLPAGATLSSNGTITGTSPVESASTTYNFSIKATDAELQDVTRSFTLTINTDVLTWVTPSSGATVILDGTLYSQALLATDAAGYTVSYSANALPTGLTLSSGTISGTPTVDGNVSTLLTATAATTNRTSTNTITWSVVLGDNYWNYTSVLLNGPASTPFINDESLNNSQLTINGDASPTKANPYSDGYYGVSIIDGLHYVGYSQPALGNTFTIEFWVYPTIAGSNNYYYSGGPTTGPLIGYNGSTFSAAHQGSWTIASSSNPTLFTWSHIALVREGTGANQFKLYINGVLTGTGTDATTFAAQTGSSIGGNGATSLAGFSNFRIVNNQALYTGTFTPSTSPLTATSIGTSGANVASSLTGTTILLTAQSARFIDNSSNNLLITPSGTPAITSAHPFAAPTTSSYNTQYSTTFDGNGDKLSIATNAAFTFGTSDFTIECWFFTSSATVSIFDLRNTITQVTPYIYAVSSTLRYYVSGADRITSTALSLNTWYHLALVRASGVTKMYLNGVQTGSSYTDANNYISNAVNIGAGYAASQQHTGLISNLRVVNGVAVYTGAFTPPTSPLTATQSAGTNISAITGTSTSLLTCQNATLKDNSINNFTITSAGDARPIALSPFTMTTSNTTVTSLGSAYFDGTGDYLTVPTNTAFEPGAGDFTIEAWFYATAVPNATNTIVAKSSTGVYASWTLYVTSTNTVTFYSSSTGTTWDIASAVSLGSVSLNTWNHVAVSRQGTALRLFLNGALSQTITTSATLYSNTNAVGIGGRSSATELYTGYISDVRFIKGTALYTSNFLPPQTPLTTVTNTQLLTLQYNGAANNNGFVDQSNSKNIVTKVGTPAQGTFSPYSQMGWSNYFDGTGDYLYNTTASTALSLASSDFTIECWFNTAAKTNSYPVILSNGNFTTGKWQLDDRHSTNQPTKLIFGLYNAQTSPAWLVSTTAIQNNTWYHVAIVRSGSTFTMYVNGTAESTQTYAGAVDLGTAQTVYVGQDAGQAGTNYNGYISNVRIVKGVAVYTGSFTVPRAPLASVQTNGTNISAIIDSQTSLLTCQTNSISDVSLNNFAFTKGGDVSVQAYSPFGGVTSVPTSYSYVFDGTAGSVGFPNTNNVLDIGTNAATMEGWFMQKTNTTSTPMTWGTYAGGEGQWGLSTYQGLWRIVYNQSSTSNTYSTGVSITSNQWYHIAITRVGALLTMFINGVLIETIAYSATAKTTTGGFRIGSGNSSGGIWSTPQYFFNGLISNVRFINGTALYTTNFTIPTSPLTTASQGATGSQVSVLTANSNVFADTSGKYISPSVSGTGSTVVSFNPFGITNTKQVSYTPAVNGGSMYFDGGSDGLTVSNSSGLFNTSASDWTVQGWYFWPSASPTVVAVLAYGQDSSSTGRFGIYWAADNYFYVTDIQANNTIMTNTTTMLRNEWVHIAVVNSGGTLTFYKNGVKVISATNTLTSATITKWYTGYHPGNSWYSVVYFSDVSLTNGALYTANFYPGLVPLSPTTTIGASTYVSTLSLNGTSGGVIDYHGTNSVKTIGDVNLAPEDPYNGSYYSNYFDGLGDYFTLPVSANLAFAGDYTIEAWVFLNSVTGVQGVYSSIDNSSDAWQGSYLGFNGTSFLATSYISSNDTITHQTTVSAGQWYHIAIVRNGSATKSYLNGVQSTGTTTSTYSLTQSGSTIGSAYPGTSPFNGYISNLRVVKGTAVYTASFTPTTTPLTAITGTQLLTCQTNKFIDNSTNNFTLTLTGDIKVKSMNPFQRNTGKSLYFDGTGDYTSILQGPQFAFGAGDYTIEAWVYRTDSGTQRAIVDLRGGSYVNVLFYMNSANQLVAFNSTSTWITSTGTISLNQWTHVAIARAGTSVKLFINGVVDGTATNSDTNVSSGPVYVGRQSGSTSNDWLGYIKDIRITKSARYTTAFTPPTKPVKTNN